MTKEEIIKKYKQYLPSSVSTYFPFKPRENCEVELSRSGQTVRLRGEVVRSFVVRHDGSTGSLRYRTALQFLETPQEIFSLLPELVEDS